MSDHDPMHSGTEGYCMRCKQSVVMQNPEPVFTSRGTPGTRGVCPECGGVVFRMGVTPAHDGLKRPAAVVVQKYPRRAKPKLPPNTVYINFAGADEAVANQLADDLNRLGMSTWLHDPSPEQVNWAGGVHPALKDCERMVLVLSGAALEDATVQSSWTFFKQKRKPIAIAQVAADVEPPDDIRRSPRFDLSGAAEYKGAFRQLVQALAR